MGRGAYFIRSQGCPLHCSFCDSAGTWHRDHTPPALTPLTPEQFGKVVDETNTKLVVLTGGEPALWEWSPYLKRLNASIEVTMETSGAYEIADETYRMLDLLTVSPKRSKMPLAINLTNADEIKLIIEKPEDITFWLNKLTNLTACFNIDEFCSINPKKTIWLHPEWSQRENPLVLNEITKWVKACPQLRAGYQLHKLYQCDQLDPNSIAPAPLGGCIKNGY